MGRKHNLNPMWRFLALILAIGLLAACVESPEEVLGQPEEPTDVSVTGIPQSDAEVTETLDAAAQATEGEDLPGTGSTPDPAASPAAGLTPPDSEACQKIAEDVQATLAAEEEAVVVEEDALFEDYLTNETGSGCQITVTGTGANFPEYTSFVDMSEALSTVLQITGWEPDPDYVADGPTGTAFAMRMDDQLALVRVEMDPAPEAGCPEDQPVSECELTPEQVNYTVQVNVARGGQPQE